MTRFKVGVTAVGLVVGMLLGGPAIAWKRGAVDVLAVLPLATGSVEGIAVGADGNIYVPTFGFNTKGELSPPPVLFVISPNGKIINQVKITPKGPAQPAASAHMIGLAFNPVTGDLLILDLINGNVLNVDPKTGQYTLFMHSPLGAGLNALTFDKDGNVYVSDSFNSIIWKTGKNGGPPTPWINDPLLGPGTGLTPPFGANGIEFSNDGKVMYVANTAFHQIIKIPVDAFGNAKAASIFITGINAPEASWSTATTTYGSVPIRKMKLSLLIKRGRLSPSLVISGASARMVSLVACYSRRAWLSPMTARGFTSQI